MNNNESAMTKWVTKKLGDCCEVNPHNNWAIPEQFIYIDLESVVSGNLIKEQFISKQEAPSRAQRLVDNGDILYQTVRPYQKNNYLFLGENKKYVASTGYALLRPYQNYESKFIYYLVHTFDFVSQVLGLCTGTSYPAITPSLLKKIEIAVPYNDGTPDLAEQRRIAGILSSADGAIAASEALIEKYRNIKRGLLATLLQPKEGWKKVKLGECLKQKPDYGINAPAVAYDNKLPTYLRITDITEDGYYSKNDVVSVADPDAYKYKMEEGDLVFARTGASVGKTYLYNPQDGILVFAGFLIRVKTDEDILLSSFFKYQTQTQQYKNWIANNSMRTGQPGINGNEYETFSFYLPYKNGQPDLAEQRRIAGILSSVDAKIAAEEKVVEKYKGVKKGLMEEMMGRK
ncbi:MAG: restriction endonuclease subunit S [Bacteroidales bacterium]|nr:restriction endonuclease subunit S [Bacteroidales bacterium]